MWKSRAFSWLRSGVSLPMVALALIGLIGNSAYHAFQEPLPVAEPKRLAMTPKIDGVVHAEEWDAFSATPGLETFFQWEPGALYAAAKLSPSQDLIVSIDQKGNGWLIGADNLQYRVSIVDGKPVVKVERLNGLRAAGPEWVVEPILEGGAVVAARAEGDAMWVELAIKDPDGEAFPNDTTSGWGVRIDPFESGRLIEPFVPRTMTTIELGLERGSNVPGGLEWKPQMVTRTVVAGETMKMRMTFNGADTLGLQRLDFSAKAADGEKGAELSSPFPKFDKKGRAFVDYSTPVPADAQPGYRLIDTVVSDKSGNSTYLRTSYRVAPRIEILIRQPKAIKVSAKDRKLRIPYYVISNAMGRAEGKVEIATPGGWFVETGEGKGFGIYNARSAVRRVFDVIVPANAVGRFPITLTATAKDKTYTQTAFVEIR